MNLFVFLIAVYSFIVWIVPLTDRLFNNGQWGKNTPLILAVPCALIIVSFSYLLAINLLF